MYIMMERLTTMTLENCEIDYTQLTKKELGLLILANDDKAIDEHIRRIRSGEIKPTRRYTLKQLDELLEEVKKKAS